MPWQRRREEGRVVSIATRVVLGTMATVLAALGTSKRSLPRYPVVSLRFLDPATTSDWANSRSPPG